MAADAITVREAELQEQIAQFEEARRVLLTSAATPGASDTIDTDGIGHGQGRSLASQRLTQIETALLSLKQELYNLCVPVTAQVAAPLTAPIGSDLSEYKGQPPFNNDSAPDTYNP